MPPAEGLRSAGKFRYLFKHFLWGKNKPYNRPADSAQRLQLCRALHSQATLAGV